ncbi:MAG: kinase [Caulobacteraceae bacterium]
MQVDLDHRIGELIAEHALPSGYAATARDVLAPLAIRIDRLRDALGRPVIVGVCGAQGSGKSTMAAFVQGLLEAQGRTVAVLSLDDLYLTRETRVALAQEHHPLFATRGVPGTHDVALGERVLDALTRPDSVGAVRLPRFDKATDTPFPEAAWPKQPAPVDVVLFEGWCVGAVPQAVAALDVAVNALERDEDPDGDWRREVNARLADDYQRLFGRLDALVLIQAPGFEQVLAWRTLQEHKLAARLAETGDAGRRVMADAEIGRFIQHYERLTRHILAEMPARADAVIALDHDHAVIEARYRPGGPLDL